MSRTLEASVREWIRDGRDDIERWAANGLGIRLHDKQLEFLEALRTGEAAMFLLWWANRAGKTIGVITWHLHGIFYKPEIPKPRNEHEYRLWQNEDYRTLHAAPTGDLATIAWEAIGQIAKGTHPVQRDLETSERRPAPLGSHFVPTREVGANGGIHMVVKSLEGGTIDMRSTEGGAGRLEGRAWRRISWDEWPQQDAADKPTAIRTVLTRLQNRASDFDAPILLTGTITPETEHIAQEWIALCEDPAVPEWWGSQAKRSDNPSASTRAMEIAERTFDPEDYARTVLGIPGGVKGRLLPSFMVEPIYRNDLPRLTPPGPHDGATFRENDRRFRSVGEGSEWFYLHVWDLAIAAAANVGHVYRLPADLKFGWSDVDGQRLLRAITGVRHVEVPGSRTLTSAEIIHTIEETFLPYGGRIVLDTTDAHGKNIYRELRRAGYPVEAFTFNERDERRVTRKEAAIHHARQLLTEGMAQKLDTAGKPLVDGDGVPIFDRDVEYGVLRLPRSWVKSHDQLSILRPDDDKQTKDEAMVVLMGLDTAYRMRRGRTRQHKTQPFQVFGR